MFDLKVGDMVMINGTHRKRYDGTCAYTDDQLVNGHLKHTVTGKAWVGPVQAINGDMAKAGGGWRGIENYTKVEGNQCAFLPNGAIWEIVE